MSTSAQQMRAWTGPALFSFGFRPFFLFGALWAGLAMPVWLLMMAGLLDLPTRLDPVSWHAHEFLYGYLGAVAAGFMLTAVPNWTGRLPIVGWPLAGLAALWGLGRVTVAGSVYLPPLAVALIDLAFPAALLAVLAREIVAGRNWRNMPVLAMLGTLILGNAVFHIEAARGGFAAGGYGLRLGVAAAVMMISVIGGRIVPSFTRNWLARTGRPARPIAFGRFDQVVLAVTLAALLAWIAAPDGHWTGVALILAGLAQALRLSRWSGVRTRAEPLVWVLHAGYAFVPLGALALGAAILWPGGPQVGAQHLWMAGAVGVMTLAVMTRATLGHTGQALTAGRGTTALYLALIGSVLLRACANLHPALTTPLLTLSGLMWIAAFGGFALLYGGALARSRKTA